jgi:hypothetical protein
MLDLWKYKDGRERRLMRFIYTRLMPSTMSQWSQYVNNCKKVRYALLHAKKQLIRDVFRRLKRNSESEVEEREREMDQ